MSGVGDTPDFLSESKRLLPALFHEAQALANAARKKVVAVHRDDRLPASGLSILQLLHQRGPLTVPGIARERLTSRQNIQIEVNRLREHGWVELAGNPNHKKSLLVRLTEPGVAILSSAQSRERGIWDELGRAIPGEKIQEVTAGLREIRGRLEAIAAANGAPPAGAHPERARRPRRERPVKPELPAAETPPSQPEAEAAVEEELPVSLL